MDFEDLVPHASGCEGFHCVMCGACLIGDPDDEEFADPDEPPLERHTCCDCRGIEVE